MTDTTPLPCPFCGGTKFQQNTKAKGYFIKKAAERAGKDTSNHLIRCTKCGAKGPLKHSEAEALTAWNTRANADARLVEALRDCLAVLTDPIVGTIYQDDPAWFEALDRAVAKARAALSEVSHG